MLAQPPYKNLSIEVIPCCADLEHFDYRRITIEQQTVLRQRLGIEEDIKIITYLGSVGGWYMTKEMFQFFKQLKEQQPQYKMLILTKDDAQKVKEEVVLMGIDPSDVLITYSDRKALPVFLAISDCSIFFIRNTFSKKASSPTKHAELMGMGVPVICNDIGDTGYIIEKTKTGMLVNEFNQQTFAHLIDNMDQFLVIDKEHIRSCALELFDLKAGAEKYRKVYHQMLDNN